MAKLNQQPDVTIIELGPEYHSLDQATVEALRDKLLDFVDQADPPNIALDLSHTRFIGSAFLETLFRCWNRIKHRDGRLALCGLHPFCSEVLRVTRLETLWEIYPTIEDAKAAMAEKEPGQE